MAWKSGKTQGVSRIGTMALGGLFLHTSKPLITGSMIEILFDLPTTQFRAQAVVHHSISEKGMGVKFVQMSADHRFRLNQFLKTQIDAGNIQEQPVAV